MLIGGSVMMGIVPATLIAAASLAITASVEADDSGADSDAPTDHGERERSIAVGLTVASGLMLAGGIALVVIGARTRAEALGTATDRVRFGVGPRGVGLRF